MVKQLLIALLAVLTTATQAGTVGVHLGSWHDEPGYNNFNPGVYYIGDEGYVVGTYYNSERHQSVYAGGVMEHGPFALMVGAVTGYENSPLMLYAVPSVKAFNFRLSWIPKVGSVNTVNVLHLSYEFKF